MGTKRTFKESSSSSSFSPETNIQDEINSQEERDCEEVRKTQKVKHDGLKTENTNVNEKKEEKGQKEKN